MSLRLVLLAGLAIVFVACSPAANNEASATPHSNQATNVPSAGPDSVQPGEWHTVVTYTSVTGLPPTMTRALMSRPHPFDGCASNGDINGMVRDAISANNMTCREDHGSAAHGVITGTATCHDERGNSGNLSIQGTFTTTHVDVTGVLNAQTQMGPVTENIHWASDHTADACASGGD